MTDQEVVESCRAHGLDVREVRRTGGVLQLVPAALADFTGGAMPELSRQLCDADPSIRWVTLVIEPSHD